MSDSIPLNLLPPSTLQCPTCEQYSLDYDMRPKLKCEKTTLYGMFALEIKVKHQPVIFCRNPSCEFIQWGRVDGIYAVFDGTPDAG